MTEQKEILEIISNRAFDIQHTDTLQVAFNKAKEIQELVDGQQPFKIGEYYKRPDNDICKITSIENDTAYIDFLNNERGNMLSSEFYIERDGEFYKQAKADEIALFKRAEHFHLKGRKLNEFKKNDLVINDGDFQIVFDIGNRLYLYNICGEVIGEQDTVFLFMTAEELEAATEVN